MEQMIPEEDQVHLMIDQKTEFADTINDEQPQLESTDKITATPRSKSIKPKRSWWNHL